VGDGDDVGTITIAPGVNFKTSITPQSAETNMNELYPGLQYGFDISIKNTGTEDCLAAVCEIDLGNGLSGSGGGTKVLGTIEPGKTKTVPVSVTAAPVQAGDLYKKIRVTVTDTINHKSWEDSVSLKINIAPLTFNIKANGSVSGMIFTGDNLGRRFTAAGAGGTSVTVPWAGQDLWLAFSGATADTEAMYSVGIGTEANSSFANFTDIGNYEPNNTETAATPVSTLVLTSYLHKNDIDYYKVNLNSMNIVPATDISGVPVKAWPGVPLSLTGTVIPAHASYRTIQWAVKEPGATGAVIDGNTLLASEEGTLVVTATVYNGPFYTGYSEDFTISVGYSVTTIVSGSRGHADGTGQAANFYSPSGIAVDSDSNLYVTDNYYFLYSYIRKITPGGVVTTITGGSQGHADGTVQDAKFYSLKAIAVDASGNLYVTDNDGSYSSYIRKITPGGVVTTIAGGSWGHADGIGLAAKFNMLNGIAAGPDGNLYVTDYNSSYSYIRKITPGGVVTTIAGGSWGHADGTGGAARFSTLNGIAAGPDGNLYVADYSSSYSYSYIRRITSAGVVRTVVGDSQGHTDGTGQAAQFYTPGGIAAGPDGNLYVTDYGSSSSYIRKIE
jgi:sugar lactone lactonase YvrE